MKKQSIVILSIFLFIIITESCRTTVATQPTATITERPAQPGPDYVWVEGEWRPRHRNYTYSQGYWAKPANGRHAYVAGTWGQRRNGYYWRPGHWE